MQTDVVQVAASDQREALSKAARKGRKAVEKRANSLKTLEITYVNRLTVTPNPYNPNRQSEHDFELLLRSMEEDGFTQPIIVNRDVWLTPPHGGEKVHFTNSIGDGEHRWRAAGKIFGETCEIPVVFVDFTEEQMRISTLRHNRARGSEDVQLTADVLRDLRDLGALNWAQDSLMMDDVEMNRLLEDVSAPDALKSEVFSEAWAPEGKKGMGTDPSTLIEGQTVTVATTQQAADEMRRRESAIQAAKTREEKEAAQADADVYRISFVFTGVQASMVRKVLGAKPAERLLEIVSAIDAQGVNASPA